MQMQGRQTMVSATRKLSRSLVRVWWLRRGILGEADGEGFWIIRCGEE